MKQTAHHSAFPMAPVLSITPMSACHLQAAVSFARIQTDRVSSLAGKMPLLQQHQFVFVIHPLYHEFPCGSQNLSPLTHGAGSDPGARPALNSAGSYRRSVSCHLNLDHWLTWRIRESESNRKVRRGKFAKNLRNISLA